MSQTSSASKNPVTKKLKILAKYVAATFQAPTVNEVIVASIMQTSRDLENYGVSSWLLLKPLARCVGNILATTQDGASVEKHVDTLCILFISYFVKADALSQIPTDEKEQIILFLVDEIMDMLENKPRIKSILLRAFIDPLMEMIIKYRGRTYKEIRELISVVITLLRGVNKELRSQLRNLHFSNVMCIIAMLNYCGDYAIQQGLVEILLRLTPTEERFQFAREAFASANYMDLAAVFQDLGTYDFESEVRLFLSMFNKNLGEKASVFTFPCETIMFGDEKIYKPVNDNFKRLQVNFNTATKSLSFWGSLGADGMNQMMLQVTPSEVEDCYLLELEQKVFQLTLCLHNPLQELVETHLATAVLIRLVFKVKHTQIIPLSKNFFKKNIQISETVLNREDSVVSSQEKPKKKQKVSEGIRIQFSQEDEDANTLQTEAEINNEDDELNLDDFSRVSEREVEEDLLQGKIKTSTPRIQLGKKIRPATCGAVTHKTIKPVRAATPRRVPTLKPTPKKRAATPGIKKSKDKSQVKCSEAVSCYPKSSLQSTQNVECAKLQEKTAKGTKVNPKSNSKDKLQPENIRDLLEELAESTEACTETNLDENQPLITSGLLENAQQNTDNEPSTESEFLENPQPEAIEVVHDNQPSAKSGLQENPQPNTDEILDENQPSTESDLLENPQPNTDKILDENQLSTESDLLENPQPNTDKILDENQLSTESDLLENPQPNTDKILDENQLSTESDLLEKALPETVEVIYKKQSSDIAKEIHDQPREDVINPPRKSSRLQVRKKAAVVPALNKPKAKQVKKTIKLSECISSDKLTSDKVAELFEVSSSKLEVNNQNTVKTKAKRGRKPGKKLSSKKTSVQDKTLSEVQSSQQNNVNSKETVTSELSIPENKVKTYKSCRIIKNKSCAEGKELQSKKDKQSVKTTEDKELQSNDIESDHVDETGNKIPCEEIEEEIPQEKQPSTESVVQKNKIAADVLSAHEKRTKLYQKEITSDFSSQEEDLMADLCNPQEAAQSVQKQSTGNVPNPQDQEIEADLCGPNKAAKSGQETTTKNVSSPQNQEIIADPQKATKSVQNKTKKTLSSHQNQEIVAESCEPQKPAKSAEKELMSDISDQEEVTADLPQVQEKIDEEMEDIPQIKGKNNSWQEFMNKADISKFSPYPGKRIPVDNLMVSYKEPSTCLFDDLNEPKIRLNQSKNKNKQSKSKKTKSELPHVLALNSSKTPVTATPGKRRLFNPATPYIESDDKVYTMQINQDFQLQNALHIQINLPSTLNINSNFGNNCGDFSQWSQTNKKPAPCKIYQNKKKMLKTACDSQESTTSSMSVYKQSVDHTPVESQTEVVAKTNKIYQNKKKMLKSVCDSQKSGVSNVHVSKQPVDHTPVESQTEVVAKTNKIYQNKKKMLKSVCDSQKSGVSNVHVSKQPVDHTPVESQTEVVAKTNKIYQNKKKMLKSVCDSQKSGVSNVDVSKQPVDHTAVESQTEVVAKTNKIYQNKKKILKSVCDSQKSGVSNVHVSKQPVDHTPVESQPDIPGETEDNCALFADNTENPKQRKVTNKKTRTKKVTDKKVPENSTFTDSITRPPNPDVLRMNKKSDSSIVNTLSKIWSDDYFDELPDLVVEKTNKMEAPLNISTPSFLKEKPVPVSLCHDKIQTPEELETGCLFPQTSPTIVTKQVRNKTYAGKQKTQASEKVAVTPKLKKRKRKGMVKTPNLRNKPTVAKAQGEDKKVEEIVSPESEGMAVFKEKKPVKKRQPKSAETATSQETVWEKPVESQVENKKALQDKPKNVKDTAKQETIKNQRKVSETTSQSNKKPVKEIENKKEKVIPEKEKVVQSKNLCETQVEIPESSSVASSQSIVEGTQLEYSAPSMLESLKALQNTVIEAKSTGKQAALHHINESSPVSSVEVAVPSKSDKPRMSLIARPCKSAKQLESESEKEYVPSSKVKIPIASKQVKPCKPMRAIKPVRKQIKSSSEEEEEENSVEILKPNKSTQSKQVPRKSMRAIKPVRKQTESSSEEQEVKEIKKPRKSEKGYPVYSCESSMNEKPPKSTRTRKLVRQQPESTSDEEMVQTGINSMNMRARKRQLESVIEGDGDVENRKSMRTRKSVRQQPKSKEMENVESRKRDRRRALLPFAQLKNQETSPKLCSTAISELDEEEGEEPACKKLSISLSPILEGETTDMEQEQESESESDQIKRLLGVSMLSKVGQDASYLKEITNLVQEWTVTTTTEVTSKRCEVLRRFCGMLQLEIEQAEGRLQYLQEVKRRQLKAQKFVSNTLILQQDIMCQQHASDEMLQKQSGRAHRKLEAVGNNIEYLTQQLMAEVASLKEHQHEQEGNKLMAHLRAKITVMLQ